MNGTKNCVYCLKREAVVWGGFVEYAGDTLTAGWCSRHASKPPGFVGHYLEAMGDGRVPDPATRTKATR